MALGRNEKSLILVSLDAGATVAGYGCFVPNELLGIAVTPFGTNLAGTEGVDWYEITGGWDSGFNTHLVAFDGSQIIGSSDPARTFTFQNAAEPADALITWDEVLYLFPHDADIMEISREAKSLLVSGLEEWSETYTLDAVPDAPDDNGNYIRAIENAKIGIPSPPYAA